jgi:hypothetical protein
MGILDDDVCDAPFSSEQASIISCWQGLQNGSKLNIYAGSLATDNDPAQGVVIFFPSVGDTGFVPTPVPAGPVRIVAVQNGLVLLVSTTSPYVFTFNSDTQSFSPTAIVPLTSVPANQVSVTASGLVFSRVTQTFNGTITIKNVGTTTIKVPVQIAFPSLNAMVKLNNLTGTFNGSPFITVPAVTDLFVGQSATVEVQFLNPTNAQINVNPVIYSGRLN